MVEVLDKGYAQGSKSWKVCVNEDKKTLGLFRYNMGGISTINIVLVLFLALGRYVPNGNVQNWVPYISSVRAVRGW